MIGVDIRLESPKKEYALTEFFELFKTPWEICKPGKTYSVLMTDVISVNESGSPQPPSQVIIQISGSDSSRFEPESQGLVSGKYSYRIGEIEGIQTLKLDFDLLHTTYELLNLGLSEEDSEEPYLDRIIQLMRDFMSKHVNFIEILPKPWGVPYVVALTHDVDHLSLKEHIKTRTFYGRVRYGMRSILKNYFGRPFGLQDEWRTWGEVGMQLVNSGLAALRVVFPGIKDPWTSFDRVIGMEDRHGAESSSFYFAQKPGRGIVYQRDSEDYRRITAYVASQNREVGVHSMDGWNNLDEAKREFETHARVYQGGVFGTRVHWLYFNDETLKIFGQAGFYYDTTFGFNKTVGFRAGVAQAYRPYKAEIWELPLHIQDGALFRRNYLSLKPEGAAQKALETMKRSAEVEGLSTLLWHVKSLSTEYTTWANTYEALLQKAEQDGAWMSSGREVVHWYSARRKVRLEECSDNGPKVQVIYPRESTPEPWKPLRSMHIRLVSPKGSKDFELREGTSLEFDV